jgi:peptidyl-prolyl cis-trans isomerase SurA
MKKKFIFLLFVVSTFSSFAQNDPVLFSVNKVPVHLSEFNYIYSKTNGNKADYSKASVDEYLDLYTKFKMKVARAKDMKLDTIPTLQEELLGYRRQLADSYLTDKEVTEKLVKEAFQRTQKDVSISHILIKIEKGDTSAFYNLIKNIKARLDKGESFEAVAKEASQDPNTQNNGGLIGYLTALLPDGFYDLETAMYTTPVGQSSGIVRSPLGYHIIKVNDVRPARGEMEIAHVMIRKVKDGVPQPSARQKADSLWTVLQTNKDFGTMALQQSEDGNSSVKGGYLGFFGIGRYELAFENAAFALEKDGDVTPVIESSIGWHIIKRISRKPAETFDMVKNRLKSRIQQDGRFELAKTAMIERIKVESKFKEDPSVLSAYINQIDAASFQTFAWKSPEANKSAELFNMGTNRYTVEEFGTYLVTNANRRLSLITDMRDNYSLATKMMYKEFVNEKALAYEETQLDIKYSDFKNLMREYEEGILLFEAIKMNVWDKASQDSVGLEKFHSTRKDKYMWAERAQLVTYSVSDSAKAELENIRKYAEKHSSQDVLKKFNKKKDIVSFSADVVEKGKNKTADGLGWKEGAMSKSEQNPTDKVWQFTKIDKLMPAATKTLKEARGFVVADYQEFLEKKWMEDLTSAYKVDIKKDVLESIIKK